MSELLTFLHLSKLLGQDFSEDDSGSLPPVSHLLDLFDLNPRGGLWVDLF